MALQNSFYNTDGINRTFPSTKHIATKQHVSVYLKKVSDSSWELSNSNSYELVNNAIIFIEAPDVALYSQIEVRVADTANELEDSPSDIAIVAGDIANINIIATNIGHVNNVSTNISAVVTVSGNTTNINNLSDNIEDVINVSGNINSVTTTSNNIASINIVANDLIEPISEIATVANDISNVNIVADAIINNTGIGGGSSVGGQFLGSSIIKGVQYMANSSAPNETITVVEGTNAFSISSFTLVGSSEIIVSNTSEYKIL